MLVRRLKMEIRDRIVRSIMRKRESVYLRKEFDKFGSRAGVNRALSQLITDGKVVRVGTGLYAPAKKSFLTGNFIPTTTDLEFGNLALKKLGVEVFPTRAQEDYNSGKTTQVPPSIVFNVGKSRIRRRIGFNGRVRFEKN